MSVLVKVRVTPDSAEVDMGKLKEEVKGVASKLGVINKIQFKPLAFGLNTIELILLVEEKHELMNKIEERLVAIDHVSSVYIENVSRAL